MERVDQKKIIDLIYKKFHNSKDSYRNGDYLMGSKGMGNNSIGYWTPNILDEICYEMGFQLIYLDIQNDLFEFEIKVNNNDPTIFINLTRHDIFYRHKLNIRDEALKNLDI